MAHENDENDADGVLDNPGYMRYGDDRLREECGVFGVFGHPDAAAMTALGLHALQHRGQEASGIVDLRRQPIPLRTPPRPRRRQLQQCLRHSTACKGQIAIGHNRYSTTGEPALKNVQPLYADIDTGGFAVAHNGNLTNALTLRQELISSGAIFPSTSDTEVILHLLSRSKKRRIVERFVEAIAPDRRRLCPRLPYQRHADRRARPHRYPSAGPRPRSGKSYVLASETCALDIVGAEFIREVENGEVVVITADGIESHRPFPLRPARPCIFEYIYFARPDSVIGGRTRLRHPQADGRAAGARGAGRRRRHRADPRLAACLPPSASPQESDVPFELGIIRNHYVGRTFIEPSSASARWASNSSTRPTPASSAASAIVLIDDSVVRGTTSKKIVQLMYEAGAREVHMRISSPPITHPDYYGIDTPRKKDLLAANDVARGNAPVHGRDSLAFLSVDGIYRAVGFDHRDARNPQFTDHCFTGEYPTELTDQNGPSLRRGSCRCWRKRAEAGSRPPWCHQFILSG